MIVAYLLLVIGIAVIVAAWHSNRTTRREALMDRAPSRERIKAVMDKLPPCDEWLDDRYDADAAKRAEAMMPSAAALEAYASKRPLSDEWFEIDI